jgi:hypothetical protein
MDGRSTADLIAKVEQVSGCFEILMVTHLKGYRSDPDGGTREIDIEIHDRGEGHKLRFYVVARDQDGCAATGNPFGDLDTTLSTVHWGELDQKHRPESP